MSPRGPRWPAARSRVRLGEEWTAGWGPGLQDTGVPCWQVPKLPAASPVPGWRWGLLPVPAVPEGWEQPLTVLRDLHDVAEQGAVAIEGLGPGEDPRQLLDLPVTPVGENQPQTVWSGSVSNIKVRLKTSNDAFFSAPLNWLLISLTVVKEVPALKAGYGETPPQRDRNISLSLLPSLTFHWTQLGQEPPEPTSLGKNVAFQNLTFPSWNWIWFYEFRKASVAHGY